VDLSTLQLNLLFENPPSEINPWSPTTGMGPHSFGMVHFSTSYLHPKKQMMKHPLPTLFLSLFLSLNAIGSDQNVVSEHLNQTLDQAGRKRWDAKAEADRDYRAAVASTFQFANRIDVYLLDFSMGKDEKYKAKEEEAVFRIQPYLHAETKILNTFQVPPKDIPTWCEAVKRLLVSPKEGGQAFCHFPIHGIRIYAEDRLLFETSICWACHNYFFTYDDQANWESITADAKDLKKLLDTFMPVPEAEIQRFHRKKNTR